ncbi:MAG: sulfur carrier protein ThiS [Lachnospiraceae bacterium]|nr:sulfur carrier protein ThiS [Lachnospiraceae bacterium]
MTVTVAGVKKQIEEGTTIAKLIVDEKVENPDYVTVTVNDDFVESTDFDKTVIKENDSIEFLYFMGGGAR